MPLGAWLRVVMALSLWHAPVPWVHFHDLESPEFARQETLAIHVAEYHSQELLAGLTTLDWHAHLVLPWSHDPHAPQPGQGDDESRPDENCVECAGSVEIAAGTTAESRWCSGLSAGLWGPGGDVSSGAGLARQGNGPELRPCQFFTTYGGAAALRNLIAVRVC
ncbi:MAG: hypothetical protein JSS02_34920 [Planctomycetes bacterium]|nr:hypothetical protein [Planctomycetota bacterium]